MLLIYFRQIRILLITMVRLGGSVEMLLLNMVKVYKDYFFKGRSSFKGIVQGYLRATPNGCLRTDVLNILRRSQKASMTELFFITKNLMTNVFLEIFQKFLEKLFSKIPLEAWF